MTENRLEREAYRLERIYHGTAIIAGSSIILQIIVYLTTNEIKAPGIAGTVLAIPASLIKAFWWRRRGDWFATTEKWWEKLEEAPPVSISLGKKFFR